MWRKRPGLQEGTPAPVVRQARIEDAALVHDLLLEFNGEALPPEALARRMRQASPLEKALLAEQEGHAAGLLVLRIVPTISSAEDWAEITEMYVRPAFRRQGTGSALIRAAEEICRARGCTELSLLVDPENLEAQAFYHASGFRRDAWGMRRRV
ncbi:MAG TPA: GNAT family N-acetyltransferase [Anaerolineae bacterium]|nr:GNAT family N-acetyltransferase [Anaerolineae bacterium]